MRILVDTNVILRLDTLDHVQHQVAAEAIDLLGNRGHQLVVVPQVLYEYWVVATRPVANNGLGLSTALVRESIEDLEFGLYRDERGIYDRWQHLVADQDVKGKNAHDARLVAAMQRHRLTDLLTFNGKDFASFGTISVFSPEDVVVGRIQV